MAMEILADSKMIFLEIYDKDSNPSNFDKVNETSEIINILESIINENPEILNI